MQRTVRAERAEQSGTLALLTRYAAVALAIVGGLEWLLGRTISRLAAAPNLEGSARDIVESIGRAGLSLIDPSFLLAFTLLVLFALIRGAEAIVASDYLVLATSLIVCIFSVLAAAAWALPALSWLAVLFNVISAAALMMLGLTYISRTNVSTPYRTALALTLIGYLCWYAIVLRGELPSKGLSGGGRLILDLGELALVCVPFVLFWATAIPYRQWLRPARWILPLLGVLLFSAANVTDMIFDQGFTAVFSLWSVGMTLFLPWPLTAVALGAFLYSLLTCFASVRHKAREANPNTGLALLLFLYAGYNLQLTYQHLLAVLAVALLTLFAEPFALNRRESGAKTPEPGRPAPEVRTTT